MFTRKDCKPQDRSWGCFWSGSPAALQSALKTHSVGLLPVHTPYSFSSLQLQHRSAQVSSSILIKDNSFADVDSVCPAEELALIRIELDACAKLCCSWSEGCGRGIAGYP